MKKFGIDVSEHQGNIDWNAVKGNVDFVILRLGWIGNRNNHTLDKMFERNYSECKRLGIPVGVYVYCYSSSETAVIRGANWTISKLNNKEIEMPVYIDMEDSSIEYLSKRQLTDICIAFNSVIESSGRWAGVYANLYWFDNKLYKDEIRELYTTWIAHYINGDNRYEGEYDMWQNSNSAEIAGISGKVDTDYLYRDLIIEEPGTIEDKLFVQAKIYKNGSTIEVVYADSSLKLRVGSLDRYEVCECLGIVNGRYIVKYKVNGTTDYKVGFVKYSGGVV